MSQFFDKPNKYAAVRKSGAVRTRFAPSPTGYLHIGHARAAFEAFDFARVMGGTCLLRIEDIDHIRCKPELTDAIYDDLSWLGFAWPQPVRLQSAHYEDYAAVIENLRKRGLIYRCFKTRREVDALSSAGIYTGEADFDEAARLLSAAPFAWRLSMRGARHELGAGFDKLTYYESAAFNAAEPGWRAANPERFGDVILARKDIGVSYHLAVTHDDALQGISHIVRGTDLVDSTDIHVLLQVLMGWPVPDYHHHGLICDQDGEKLAKRKASTAIAELRAAGHSPAAVLAMAGITP
ncbi:tRNA glutamyl-Q(34) synthetase GluQRS [Robiginitomaculum antarcticum]|uniref:tRNA glutamyl-Q(34) synthetase GluQRS n=1 Tax=Robiginitomaculum antarcticum TaxID=437507 RepID=UPI00037ABD3B|nr:tRNA glutamyl-Q(34) synthetase GluQRS [Robiginitomaculum antarcticum]